MVELGSPRLAGGEDGADGAAGGEVAVTVWHNGFVVTNVPASEVSKVRRLLGCPSSLNRPATCLPEKWVALW